MQTYSQAFHDAIIAADREIRGYIKFNGTFTLDGAGGLISFTTTQNAMDAERFCVGSVCSAMCEASFYNEGMEGSGVSLANSYFDAYIGVVTDAANDTVEYVCCGRYYISEITRSTATTKIVGYDIAGRLSMDYVPTVTADPDHGYLVMDILNDIIDQTGVNGGDPFTTFGDSTYVPEIFLGNCRAQWGWLCSLIEGTASNYSGTREPADLGYIKTYVAGNGVAIPYAVDESTTYMDGLSLGDAYTITSFTSGTTDVPIVIGNGTGMYGLNPYMTTAVATTIEGTMDGYQYYPATLHWRGDPCLDILDEINVTKGADTYKIVVMKIETTFNGGLEQTISCYGDSEAYYALSTSPTQGAINRVSNLVQEMQQAIETADNGVCTKILDTDGTWKELVIANNQDLSQATSVWRFNINGLAHSNRYSGGTYTLAMDTQGRIVANVIQTGILQDAQGNNSWNLDTGALTITNGSVNIHTSTETDDVIELSSNVVQTTAVPVTGTVSAQMQPTMFKVFRDATYYSNPQEPQGRKTTTEATLSADGTQPWVGLVVNYYDSGGTITRKRQTRLANGSMVASDALYTNGTFSSSEIMEIQPTGLTVTKGTVYSELGNEGLELYWSRNLTAKLSGAAFTSLGGSLQLYDTNANERARLHADGLTFFNSSGTQTASYPSTGLPMLTANATVNSNALSGQLIDIGYLGYWDLSIADTATDQQTAEAFLKYVCAHYTNAVYCIFRASIQVGSMRIMECSVYNTGNTSGGLPQYAVGTMRQFSGRTVYFDASSYSVSVNVQSDYIVEQGTSSLGVRYRKWKSGWGECWYTVALASRAFSAWGNSYYSPELGVVAFPISFSSAPREYVSPISGSAWCWIASSDTAPTATKSGGYRAMRPVSGSANVGLTIYSCGQLA